MCTKTYPILFACVFICTASFTLFAQSNNIGWEEMMLDPKYDFYQVRTAFNKAWQDKPYQSGSGYKPFKRWEYLMETMVDSNGFYNERRNWQEFQKFLVGNGEKSGAKSAACSNPNVGGNWTPLGPFDQPAGNNGIGRINVIAFHPSDPNIFWIGAPVGGLWKTTDGGMTWTTNSDNFQNLGVSDIAIHPTNPNIMYLGTGDRDGAHTYTYGLLKSTDGGANWTLTSLPVSSFNLIHRVLINPSNPDILLVATSTNLWRSTNAGATWTPINSLYFRALEFHPTNQNIVYAASYPNAQFYRSTDNGQTFTQISLPPPASGNVTKRFAIAVTPNNPDAVFLLGAYESAPGGNDFNGLFKSTDSGQTFTQISVTTPPTLGSQYWWDWTLTVSPVNQNELYAGGVGYYKTTDGGANWVLEQSGGGVTVHVDHHFSGYQPGTNTLFVGCDGGIFKTPDSGVNWFNLNDGLSITQYYRLAASATDPDLMLAGSQDNGTHRLLSGNWAHIYGGDGMDCLISHNNDNVMFVSWQNGNVLKSTNGGSSFTNTINPTITGETGAWVTPFVMDPTNSNILYAGYKSIWKTTDQGATWTNPFGPLTNEQIQHIAIAPSNTDVIYATDYFQIWKSTNAGLTWTLTGDPGTNIRSIAVHTTDPNTLWACVGFDIYKSTNGGASWTDVSGNLPNIHKRSIVFQPNANNAIYVSSELGVYFKNDLLPNWELFSNGLPNVRVDEIQIFPLTGKIRAATHGRGLWESDLYCVNEFTCNAVLDTFPYAESFETNLGTWVQEANDGFDWTRISGPTPTANTGPDAAFHGSYYVYAEATGHTGLNTVLRSPCLNLQGSSSPALFFRYHAYGANIGTLSVEVSTNFGATWTNIWSLSGNQGNDWFLKSLDLSPYAGSIFLIRFKAEIAGDAGDIALDDIHIREGGCGTVVSAFPYIESFETNLGAWMQSNMDQFDWTRQTGSTPNSVSGPDNAYQGSWYLFLNSAFPNNPNKTAILLGPCFNLVPLTNPAILFSYHMYGSNMGTLTLEASTDDGLTWASIWSLSGNQGNVWHLAQISLSAYAGQTVKFRFKGTTLGSTSEMAIDMIRVFENGTLPPDCTTLTSPPPNSANIPVTAGLNWAAANLSPAGYRLDVGTSPGGTDVLNNFDAGNVTDYNPPGDFAQLSPVYVKIKPYNANGEATGCPEQNFTTGQILSNPSDCQLNIPFPDNSCNLSHRFLINVTGAPGTQLGADVYLTNVKLIVEHTQDDNLDMTLFNPNNASVLLSSDNGGTGDNYGDPQDATCTSVTNFNMSAGTSIISGTAPFIGLFRPEGNFTGVNNGGSPNGLWTLEICDDLSGNTGNLDFVELVFGTPPPCTNLTAPLDGETDVSVTSALAWAAPSIGNPTGYRLDVGTTPGGTQILNNFNAGNVTTYDPSGNFPYNTTIYVKIKPYNSVGTNLTCMEESFTTQIAPPSCTNMTIPTPGSTNIPVATDLTWSPAAGNPTGYRLDVGTTSGGTQILNDYDVGNVTTFDPPGDFPYNTFIYVKVKPYNGTGTASGCPVQNFRTQIAPPACTSLSSPANGAINVAITTALSWPGASGSPAGYRLDVGTTSGGTDILDYFDVGLVTTYNPPGDFPYSTTIYVKITPYNATGSASGCIEKSFTTQIPPPNCTNLTNPVNGATDIAITAALNWAAATGAPTGYRLDVGYTPGGTQILNNFNAGNATTYNPSGNFLYDTLIYVKIKPFNGTGSAANCPEESFRTQIPPPNCTSMNFPVPSSTNIPVSSEIGWPAATGTPTGYRLDIGTTSGGTQILNNFDVGNVTLFDPPGNLPYNTNIYVRVKPYNGTGTVTNCTVQTFKTQIAPPNCTSMSSPANGANNVAVTASLTWTAASGSPTGYRLDVGTSTGGTDILDDFDVGLVTTYNPPGDFPYGTTIYVTVKPYNGTGSATGCVEKSFTTVAPPLPGCASLSSPANGASGVVPTAYLTWTAATGAPAGYRLDLGTTPGGTQILNNFDVGNVLTFDPPGYLPYDSTLYLKVKPYNVTGMNSGCAVENFTVASCIPNLSVVAIPVPNGSHRSLGELMSHTSWVTSGSNVEFTSDTAVTLQHDFTVEFGGLFEIRIQGCPQAPNVVEIEDEEK